MGGGAWGDAPPPKQHGDPSAHPPTPTAEPDLKEEDDGTDRCHNDAGRRSGGGQLQPVPPRPAQGGPGDTRPSLRRGAPPRRPRRLSVARFPLRDDPAGDAARTGEGGGGAAAPAG